jgi:hypothetical protein
MHVVTLQAATCYSPWLETCTIEGVMVLSRGIDPIDDEAESRRILTHAYIFIQLK